MTEQKIIQHYNRLNGKSISLEKLKSFHATIKTMLPGASEFRSDLENIANRIDVGIQNNKNEDVILVACVPIDLNRKTGSCVRVGAHGNKLKKNVVVESEKPKNLIAEEISIDKVHTDTKRFQNRQDAFSEASANSVAENYDPNKFDPIVVWQDPKAKKIFVLSGHSRFEGMKRRKSKVISVRYFKGSEDQAIQFAKVEANRGATQETLIEDLAAYRLTRDGDQERGIKKLTKGELSKIFKGKVQKLEAYSYLNSRGLFVEALSQSNTSNYPYLERNAQWIGQLRKDNPVISNVGEDNIFHFFYSDKTGKHLKLSKDEFFKLSAKKINQLGKDESILFPECSSGGCTKINDKESDPLKGDSYRRLREINETLSSIQDKLKSNDPKVRVSTQAERDYLIKELAPKLEAEKTKIQNELNVADRQETLFGLGGKQYSFVNDKAGSKKKKGKLNDLQAAQLQDSLNESIKAGNAPRINKVSKTRNKGWTDTPLFESGLKQQQASLFGFTTSDKAPDKPADTFRLPGVMGNLLGDLQRYKLSIVVSGETHSSKSQLSMQIVDAFISMGDDVAWIDWEQGGLKSKDTTDSIKRNVKPENKKKLHVSSDVPKTLEAVKSLTKHFKVIALDSGSSLKLVSNAWIDELREQYPGIVWIPMMQQTEKGGTRGGSAAEFDAPVVLKTYRPDQSDYKKNYAKVFKNRGNKTGIYYNISSKKIISKPEDAV